MVDELDLVMSLRDVEPLPAEAFDQARAVLQAALADGRGTSPAAARAGGHPHRRALLSGAAGLGLTATAAAVALVLSSAAAPRPAAGHPAAGGPAQAHSGAPAPSALNAPLVGLASYITANYGRPPGNATLVIRTQTYPGRPASNGINPSGVDLYTDSGDYYWAPAKSGLPAEIAAHETTGGGMFGREVAVALYAVNGNLATARARMATANFDPGVKPRIVTPSQLARISAAVKAAAKRAHHKIDLGIGRKLTPGQQRLSTDNYIWNNCLDALTAGGGDPRVRVGVLRLLATLPEVTVANSNRGGQPVLVLTAGSSLFGGLTREVLTISARSGIPISLSNVVPGQRQDDETTTYQVSRVTLAAIEAGRF